MPSKKNRLSAKEFEYVFQKGKSFKNQTFFVKVLKNDFAQTRVGVGLTKKLAKKAVQRNRYKRILRHISKEVLADNKFGYDVVIIGNENVANKTFEDLQKEAHELLHRTGIFEQ